MIFKILCKTESGRNLAWEEYNKDIVDAQEWAQNTINNFNNTLHLGEEKRILLDVIVLDATNDKLHNWVKKNWITTFFRGEYVDLMYCEKCGITGKRYGISSDIKVDSKYRSKVFKNCDTAKKAINKNIS